jgi:hypothetical protein
VSTTPIKKPLPDPSRHPDLLPKRPSLDPAKATEYRRQGRLFFGAALFFGLAAIMLLGFAAINQDIGRTSGPLIALISIVAMVASSASLVFGIVRLCQAAGANQGCAAVLAIFVGGILIVGMIYQLIWYFLLRKPPGGPVP